MSNFPSSESGVPHGALPLESKMQTARDHLSNLADSITELERRLVPLLEPEGDKSASPPREESNVPILTALQIVIDGIECQTSRIANIITRLVI